MKLEGKGYSINAKAKQAEILIYEDIGEGWFGGISAKKFVEDLNKIDKVDALNIRINSPGGSVFEGNTIYNAIKRYDAKVNVSIDGLAASIASIVAMAGDTITIAENGFLMIHDPWMMAMGSADELRNTADTLDKVRDQLVSIYAKRTKKDANDISEMMHSETWMNASEALEMGFVDSITEGAKMAASIDREKYKYAHVPHELEATIISDVTPIISNKTPIIDSLRSQFAHAHITMRKMKI